MSRLLSPDDKCVQVDAPSGRRYSGKTLEVSDSKDIRALRAGGYTVAAVAGAPTTATGFVCRACGFKSFFKICKCGAECVRPDLAA
jgi:hypothetical protein